MLPDAIARRVAVGRDHRLTQRAVAGQAAVGCRVVVTGHDKVDRHDRPSQESAHQSRQDRPQGCHVCFSSLFVIGSLALVARNPISSAAVGQTSVNNTSTANPATAGFLLR